MSSEQIQPLLSKHPVNNDDPEPTLRDVIDAINGASTDTAIQFTKIDERFTKIDERFTKIDERFTKIDERLDKIETTMVSKEGLKQELAAMETRLVTKDYLDEKLHELRGDLTVIIRKEDRKVVALIDELRQTKVLSEPAAQRILSLEPFPQS